MEIRGQPVEAGSLLSASPGEWNLGLTAADAFTSEPSYRLIKTRAHDLKGDALEGEGW